MPIHIQQATIAKISPCSSSLEMPRRESRSEINLTTQKMRGHVHIQQATTHSTSYGTFNKLPHIHQYTTHPTNYRTFNKLLHNQQATAHMYHETHMPSTFFLNSSFNCIRTSLNSCSSATTKRLRANGYARQPAVLSIGVIQVKIRQASGRRHVQQATTHSTSYHTFNKLPHIQQATTHSTSYRTLD